MIKAFVLIVVDPAKTIEVFAKLSAVEGISETVAKAVSDFFHARG